jgi:hypothetical protein
VTPAEILRELDELDHRLERLRIKYDQFFTGTEKALPYVLRKDIDRRFQALHREQMRNTGARFRFQTLVQRFTSYQTYWNRIIRQIEEGTYRRDVIRAQRLGLGMQAVRDAKTAFDDQELDPSELEEIEPLEPEPEPQRPAPVTFKDPFEDVKPHAPATSGAPRLDGVKEPSIAKPLPQRDSDPFAAQRAASIPARPATLPPGGRLAPPRAPTPPALSDAPPGTRPSSPTVSSLGSPGAAPPVRPPSTTTPPPAAQRLPVPPGASSLRAPPVSKPSAPAPAPPPRVSAPPSEEVAMRSLFDRYVAARRETGESADVRYETVARQVRETLPRLAEKYQGADVRLDVTIKDGKAILRPVVTMKK